jgi:hypothetical protein
MDTYTHAVNQIVREQQMIIGPLALDQAKKVPGIEVTANKDITLNGDGKQILDNLVRQYATFFGNVSVEVCRDAIRELQPTLPTEDLPDILR